MFRTHDFQIAAVDVEPGRRAINLDTVKALAKSIEKVGLQTMPAVRVIGDGEQVILVTGAHRLEAMKLL